MAKKSSYRRKYKKLKSSWYNKKYSIGDVASGAYNMAKKAISLINVEKKVLDAVITVSPSTTGTIQNISGIATGSEYNQRNGNSVKAVSLLSRCTIQMNVSATYTYVRHMLVIDKNAENGTPPTITDILEQNLSQPLHLAPLNHNNVGRFQILSDRLHNLNSVNLRSKVYKEYRKMQHHIHFQGSTYNAFAKGHIYMVHISSEATNTPTINYQTRLSYIDN